VAKDAATSAVRWAQNLGAATPAITEGVNAVTVSPGVAAAKQADVWLANLNASKAKFIRNVGAVSLGDWQAAMRDKGINRIGAGATAAIPKMTAFLQAFIPHVEAGVRALPPRGTLEQNLQRMVQMARHNATFTGGSRGR
jgi:hypothetical protein